MYKIKILIFVIIVCLCTACKPEKINIADLNLKGAYIVNDELYVNTFGLPEEKPLTKDYYDFKPSWSKTGNKIVFFRGFDISTPLPNWKTAICIINTDGSGFKQLTEGSYLDCNPTWSRDGSNTIVFSRWVKNDYVFKIYFTATESEPGDEVPVSDPNAIEFAYSCLMDGRIFISSTRDIIKGGYYLFTAQPGGIGKYELIHFEFNLEGPLDRVSISPSETKITYEYIKDWTPFEYEGKTIYIADFNKNMLTVSNPKAITTTTPDPHTMTLYPRWSSDESAVIYHCDKSGYNQLYMYVLADESTHKVSTNSSAHYQYACGETTPK